MMQSKLKFMEQSAIPSSRHCSSRGYRVFRKEEEEGSSGKKKYLLRVFAKTAVTRKALLRAQPGGPNRGSIPYNPQSPAMPAKELGLETKDWARVPSPHGIIDL
ncbi:unnamed protein product [Cuscuta campestris]|uniref:Uncharacterized protein n=1 Tax=Cuscuta campestris TaxID=132261 RepID=A0A484KLB1_9ASTE|nr:unnamed protein product [Cuscuta campestris]